MDPSGPDLAHETGRTVASRRGFGAIEKLASRPLPSAIHRARPQEAFCTITFDTKLDAEALARRRTSTHRSRGTGFHRASVAERSRPDGPDLRRVRRDVAGRSAPSSPRRDRTTDASSTDDLLPIFGAITMRAITPESVRTWHARYGTSKPTVEVPGLLAAAHDPRHGGPGRTAPANPCHIRGAGNVQRVHKVEPATLDELEIMTEGHAAALPAHAAARRLVRHAVRRADRAAPQGHRPHQRRRQDPSSCRPGATASSSSAPPRPTPAPATSPSRLT